MNESSQIIVVGAGIAGLTAAWQLQKSGISVEVLEAESIVGGRMQSIRVDDAIIDSGAQFLSNIYSVIPKLIQEAGLSDSYVATKEWVGLISHKHIALIHSKKPWHLVSSHLLSVADFFRLGLNQFKIFALKKKSLSFNDITTWIQYDDILAYDWIVKNFGKSIADELTSTLINGFYFQSLKESSASLAAAVVGFSAYKPQTMTLTGGMGSLPKKMAEQLNVKVDVRVLSIEENSTGVVIATDSGTYQADHVILAVPAPNAKKILRNPDAHTSALFDTTYSSSATISFLTQDDWSPPESISCAYGFLFKPRWNTRVAAMTIENNKCASRKTQGYLINIMLSDLWAKKMLHLSDDEIVAEIRSDVENVFPAIYQHIQAKNIFRWENAMPCTPIGRAKLVKDYRDSRVSTNRVWLAGDYLGFPWTDSAAQTGVWASSQVIQSYLL
ncbi:MAG: NAD(P)/FAD-dependent oxidoreductase [Gammaproteobacteria bacterium]